MLFQLSVNHFAIASHLDIAFSTGMSVITGETGAGKSIALDALGICLGQRIDSTMLQDQHHRTDICATFILSPNTPAYQWLNEQELIDPDNPESCILRRVINPDGRSKGFINGTPVAIQQLKNIGQFLVQINGQHTAQQLLRPEYQMQLLDSYSDNANLLQKMQSDYKNWKNTQQQLTLFRQQCLENIARKQLLTYQVEELDTFAIKENEYNDLENEYTRLSNTETLNSLSQSALQLLSANEEVNIDSLLYRTTQHIDELISLDPRYEGIQNLLQEARIQIQEASSELKTLNRYLEQDPQLLQHIEHRLTKCIDLARKHNVKPTMLHQWHKQLKNELEQLVDFSENEQALILAEDEAYKIMQTTAEALHRNRVQSAQHLAKLVTSSIQQLAMENAEFSIHLSFDKSHINACGGDKITFYLRSNLGQPSQALNKIVSGGELSRIALSLLVLTSNKNAIPTVIFDEIDVGMSGTTASVVGQLLRNLSHKTQVICVTHLPQVASYGHHHFFVEKRTVNNCTETSMRKLSSSERTKSLAQLLAGIEITDTVLANAQEMLDRVS